MGQGYAAIITPLFLMGIVGLVGVAYGATIVSPDLGTPVNVNQRDVLVDSGGHPLCYYDFSPVGEAGVPVRWHNVYTNQFLAKWENVSGQFFMYWGVGTDLVNWNYVSTPSSGNVWGTVLNPDGVQGSSYWQALRVAPDMLTSLYINILAGGLTAIVAGCLVGVALVGFNFLGSGESEYAVRTIMTIGFFSLLWALVTAVGVSTLTSVPVVGWLLYLLFTFAYFLGVWGEING
jgi:hypothetical protein